MFQVKQKIIHPKFGACVVSKVEEKIILGQTENCFVLEPLFDNPTQLRITIPQRSAEEIGLRPPLDDDTIEIIEKLLLTQPDDDTLKNNTSTPYIREKIHSGEVIKIAEALRDLFFKNRVENGKYSNVNRRSMFKKAFKLLSAELAISRDISVDEASGWISTNLDRHKKLFH